VERVTVRRARTAALLGLTLALACARDNGAAAPGPYAREVAEAVPMIEMGTGLKFKKPPAVQSRSKAEVRQFLEQRFKEELTDQEISGTQTAYRRLGLIPDSLDLKKFMLDLLTEQVVGFYDPKTKVLYVVRDAPREQVGFVVSHELVHALQDQYMNLDSIQDLQGENDRQMAAQAVIEGQATLVPIQAALGPGANLPAGWDRVRDLIREEQSSSMPVFASAPPIIQESLIFPYLSGAEFMRRFNEREPKRVPYGASLPRSTEQILHVNSYFAAKPDEPLTITLPAPKGATNVYENNFGEFETRVAIFQALGDQNEAVRAAAGWGGDRYMVLKTDRGDGLIWLTAWDTAIDAAEFTSAIEDVVAKRFGSPRPGETPGGKVYTVRGRTIRLWGGEVAGHTAVLYEDLPSNTRTDVLDVTRVTIR
jgi:hypothetical protein